jgi:hypothetical protein
MKKYHSNVVDAQPETECFFLSFFKKKENDTPFLAINHVQRGFDL